MSCAAQRRRRRRERAGHARGQVTARLTQSAPPPPPPACRRTIHTDVLFGLLKGLLKKRPNFKLIVTSATLDAEKFSRYFFECPIFTIPGRMFPVEILYTKEPESDYLDATLITVMQVRMRGYWALTARPWRARRRVLPAPPRVCVCVCGLTHGSPLPPTPPPSRSPPPTPPAHSRSTCASRPATSSCS